MRPKLELFIRGLPKGQPRARATRFGAHARVYNPGDADGWKTIVRTETAALWDKVQFEGAVRLELNFFMARPKHHYNKKGLKPNAPRYHTSRPDADNLAKSVMDALSNLGVWKDDCQVSCLSVTKFYVATLAGATGMLLSISEACQEQPQPQHHVD